MNYSNNDYTDISGGILFASLYNSSKNKDNMSITDQMAEDGEYGNVVDIVLGVIHDGSGNASIGINGLTI